MGSDGLVLAIRVNAGVHIALVNLSSAVECRVKRQAPLPCRWSYRGRINLIAREETNHEPQPLFDDDAISALFEASCGVPRRLNRIASLPLP